MADDAIAANSMLNHYKDLKVGDIISFDDLEAKKPKNYGILASKFQEVIGKKLTNDMNQWDFLNEKDIV